MFGAKFYEQFGPQPNDSWRDTVGELDAAQVREALRKIRNGGSAFPPSLPEFVALAKNSPVQRERANHPHLDDFERFGQRRIFELLWPTSGGGRGSASEASLVAIVARKNQLVQQFRSAYAGSSQAATDEDVAEWREIFRTELEKLWQPRTEEEIAGDKLR